MRGRRLAFVLAGTVAIAQVVGLLPGGSPVAEAQDASAATAWVTLQSVTPASGCWVNGTVEVRRDGDAVPNVDVGMSLSLDGDVGSTDNGVTDGDGLSYLGVDTGWVPAGRQAWLDVSIAGNYAGGMPVAVTDDGSCDDDPHLIQIGTQVPGATSDAGDFTAYDNVPSAPAFPTYVQQRNLSCEYASLVIAMRAYGDYGVSEYDFDSLVGWSDNPHWGYRGDITGWWGNTTDYGVYAEPLAAALPHFGYWGDVFYGQGNASALTSRLDDGTPTLVWIGEWGDTSFEEQANDGSFYKLATGEHVVVAYDYDDNGVYVSDPATGSLRFFDWGTFMWMWNVLDGMSLAVGPS